MSRLIDADALMIDVREWFWSSWQVHPTMGLDDIERLIYDSKPIPQKEYTEQDVRDAFNSGYSCGIEQRLEKRDKPTIDPVVHGEWIYGGNSVEVYHNCSICGNTVWGYNLPKYCDECGAKMDGGKDEYQQSNKTNV